MLPLLNAQPIPHLVLLLYHMERQSTANTKKHKECPLPPKWIDGNAEHEPVDEFRIGEEVESFRRRSPLNGSSHIDPLLHPVLMRPSERIDEEHEEETSVDTNVIVSDCADGVDIGAIVRADGHVLGWEYLEIPVRWLVWLIKAFAGEKVQAGSLVAGCHDDHITLYD